MRGLGDEMPLLNQNVLDIHSLVVQEVETAGRGLVTLRPLREGDTAPRLWAGASGPASGYLWPGSPS